MFLRVAIFAAFTLHFASGVEQSFTFFSGENYTGEYVRVTVNSPDVTLISPIIQERKSYCVQGWWLLMREKNYNENGGIGAVWFSKSDDETCIPKITNHIYDDYMSLRSIGASDTDNIGLSLYSEEWYYGESFEIGDEDVSEIPFPVRAYGLTGSSTWTFYVKPNFEGFAYCVSAAEEKSRIVFPTGTSTNIRSVKRGCHLN